VSGRGLGGRLIVIGPEHYAEGRNDRVEGAVGERQRFVVGLLEFNGQAIGRAVAGFAFAATIAAIGFTRSLVGPLATACFAGMTSGVMDANSGYLLGSSAGFTYVIAKGPWPCTCTTVSSDAQA
jgi:hypothetical protein